MIIQHRCKNGDASTGSKGQGQLVALTLAGFGVALAGTGFCIVQIYKTAQLPDGDGTGMQWVIVTPLTMLFLFIVVPAFLTGVRGFRVMKLAPKARRSLASDYQNANGAAGPDQAAQPTEAGFHEAGGSSGTEMGQRVLPGKGWLIALGLLALYLLAPFILAPLFGLSMDD